MKKIIIALALLLPVQAHADTVDQKCTRVGTYASLVMKLRQKGQPMNELMRSKPEMRKIIIAAFEVPGFQTEEMQEKAASDFQNEVELTCYKQLEK